MMFEDNQHKKKYRLNSTDYIFALPLEHDILFWNSKNINEYLKKEIGDINRINLQNTTNQFCFETKTMQKSSGDEMNLKNK